LKTVNEQHRATILSARSMVIGLARLRAEWIVIQQAVMFWKCAVSEMHRVSCLPNQFFLNVCDAFATF
jgi:hypothetical protein